MAKIGQLADSAQQISDTAELAQFYDNGVSPTYNTSGGPFSDRSYRFSNEETSKNLVGCAAGDEVYFSCYIRFAASNVPRVISIWDTGGIEHIRIGINLAGNFTIGRASTVLATSTRAFSIDTWYGFEFRGVIHNSTGYGHIYIDGSAIATLSLTGADLQNGGVTTPGAVYYGSSTATAVDYAHVLCITDSTTITTLNAPRLPEFMPTADTAQEDFTRSTGADSYALLDETPGDDGDTTYIESSTVGHITRVTGAGLSYTPAAIHFVVVNLVSRKDDAGARTARIVIKSGATTANGTTQTIGTTYRHYQDFWFTDPNTGSAWTKSAVDALEFGVEVVA